jgi:hypothetical protein
VGQTPGLDKEHTLGFAAALYPDVKVFWLGSKRRTAAVVAASGFETELVYFRRIVSAWFLLILACDP